jgi:DNA-binding MarR family transcriptional regulator
MDDHLKASEAYESVMKASSEYPAIKSKATIELGKALKAHDPSRAADVFLQFYYLFPTHPKSQVALFESCRLRARLLRNWSDEERKLKVDELQRLVAKLENQKERRDLNTYISGLR